MKYSWDKTLPGKLNDKTTGKARTLEGQMVGVQALRTLERKKQTPRKHVAKRLSLHLPPPRALFVSWLKQWLHLMELPHSRPCTGLSDKGQEDNGGTCRWLNCSARSICGDNFQRNNLSCHLNVILSLLWDAPGEDSGKGINVGILR